MKYRTISRLIYLKRSRHRRGHGIHSPFLFHLITTVIEERSKLSEYKLFSGFKVNALKLIENVSDPSLNEVYRQFNLSLSDPRKLYRKVEMPFRYGKVIFRLIRYFKPSIVVNYGPTLGANLSLMSIANRDCHVYQETNEPVNEFEFKKFFCHSLNSNIHFFHENSEFPVHPEFTVINYPDNPDLSRSIVQKSMKVESKNDVTIIRGIHESKAMELVWQEINSCENVRVSLDLFEIGIVLFRKGLQKENFILWF